MPEKSLHMHGKDIIFDGWGYCTVNVNAELAQSPDVPRHFCVWITRMITGTWLYFHVFNSAQVIPSYFRFTTPVSVNGSNTTGRCSNLMFSDAESPLRLCFDPTSSVLFDDVIPTLTGLDGNMWAAQLLTLRNTAPMAGQEIFNAQVDAVFLDSTALSRVEVVMFNCQSWGIGAPSITIITENFPAKPVNVGVDSCNSLVRTCVTLDINDTDLVALSFLALSGSEFVHLAEVTFYSDADACPPDAMLSPASSGED